MFDKAVIMIAILLLAILVADWYFAETAPIATKLVTISSDESEFVKESRLQEKFNSAEIDRQVALFNLQNNTAKRIFSGELLETSTPARLLPTKRSQPGKLSPGMQK